MKMTFCSVYSGSSGNCQYIKYKNTNILIDAGLSGKKIQEGLCAVGVLPENIDGIFITHEHSDHIKGAGIISRRFDIPIFASEMTWEAMKESLGAVDDKNIRILNSDEKIGFMDLEIESFRVYHDAAEPVGYNIYGNKKISLLTDTGCVDDYIKTKIKGFDLLLLESNHDVELLKTGKYPYYLKKRILSEKGHLSNETAGNFLCSVAKKGTEKVYLGHLSKENNFPELAEKTVLNILTENNIFPEIDIFIKMTYRDRPSCVSLI